MKNEIAESQTRRANLLLTVPRNAGISRECYLLRQFSCRMTTRLLQLQKTNAMLVFVDNAAFSNLPTAASGFQLLAVHSPDWRGANIAPPPPPPAVVSLVDNETITTSDTVSFPDVFDGETIHVTYTVSVTVFDTPVGATSV